MAQVYVVDRAAFFAGQWPHGFHAIAAQDATTFLERAFRMGRFVERDVAERTPAWKQWIPYCVLRCRSGPNPGSNEAGILAVQRTKDQSEARLHGSWSVGLGGHIEPEDLVASGAKPDGASFFATALARELREELDLSLVQLPKARLLGLLNDDSTEVGSVHAGLAYVLDVALPLEQARTSVRIREISKMKGCLGSLVEFDKLWQDPAKFESWSQFLIHAGVAGHKGELPSWVG